MEEVKNFFAIGKFSGKWGGAFIVEATDYLAMPHPACGEVYVIKHDLFQGSYARHALQDHIPPTEKETFAQWESVLRQDSRVGRKKANALAKIVEQDGTLDEIMNDETIDVEIPQQEEGNGMAMVPLRSGGRAAPAQDAASSQR